MSDPDMVSTQLVASSNGAVKISAGTRRPQEATAGFYDRNPNEQQLADVLAGPPHGAPFNETLDNRLKGIDKKAPGAAAQQKEVRAVQRWITEHAEQLEAERADFNRGIVRRNDVLFSAGRGFLIDSGNRGVFLAGDTEGMNTSYREELVNDSDTTPLDRAQDNAREAQLNNQIDPETAGVGFGGGGYAGSAEAQKTAREYSGIKLKFKNLGSHSASAMPAGEAYYPRQEARRYLADLEADRQVARGLDQVLGPSWQAPDLSVRGSFLNEDDTYRSRDDVPVNLTREWTAGDTPSQSEREHDPRQMAGRLKVEVQGPVRPPAAPDANGAIDPYASYGTRGITSDPRPPITDFDELAALTSKTPRSQITALGSAATAIAHQVALRARANFGEEPVRDDQQLRDASDRSLLDRGEVSGLGRRGSTFEQEPLAPIPSRSAGAAGLDEQAVMAGRAASIADYMDKLVAGGMRSSADGSRLIFKNQPGMRPYQEPSDRTALAIAAAARRRGGF